jgi:chromosome segregation ATPase
MPYEIRLNMFLVQCSDINNLLCEKCEDLITEILNKVGDHVFHKMAPQISQDVKAIREEMQQKASDSQLLVRFEAKLDNVRMQERKRLMNEYEDMIEWLMMLNRNPRYKSNEENIKPVTIAYNYINDIVSIIETSENKLKAERLEIENALMEQTRNFAKELEETQGDVLAFATKENNHPKRAQELKSKIKEIIARLKYLSEEMARIHDQQGDLDMMLGEYPLVDQLKIDIIPHEKLWNLQVQFDTLIKEWKTGPLKNLHPDDVESQHKNMRSLAAQLSS